MDVTRRHLAIIAAFAAALFLAHLAFPRFEWRAAPGYQDALIRIDRWTGTAEIGAFRADWGRWVSQAEMTRAARAASEEVRRLEAAKTKAGQEQLDALVKEIDKAIGPEAPAPAPAGSLATGAAFNPEQIRFWSLLVGLVVFVASMALIKTRRSFTRVMGELLAGVGILGVVAYAAWSGYLPPWLAIAIDWVFNKAVDLAVVGLLVYGGIRFIRRRRVPAPE